MARCEGTTKDGARCRRPASTDSAYCSWHSAQADPDPTGSEAEAGSTSSDGGTRASTKKAGSSRDRHGRPARERHPLAGAAVVGVVAVLLLALRRVIRF